LRYYQYFGHKLTMFGRYSHHLSTIQVPASIPGLAGGNSNGNIRVMSWQIAPGATYRLSARSVVEFRLSTKASTNFARPSSLRTPQLESDAWAQSRTP
jgi:hypothetical protein